MGSEMCIRDSFGTARLITNPSAERPSRLKFVKDGYSPKEFYHPGEEQGRSSDLYSLGATLFHLIAGQAPVDAETRLAAVTADDADPYEPLAGRFTGFAPRFLVAIDTALAVFPEDRIRSADDWLIMIVRKPASKALSEMASRTVATVGSTLVSGPAANNPRLIKGAVAALAVLVLTALGLVGFEQVKQAREAAFVPVAASGGPEQPQVTSLATDSGTVIGEFSPVNTDVWKLKPAQVPVLDDIAPQAVAELADVNIQVADVLAVPPTPAIEPETASGFVAETVPALVKSVAPLTISDSEAASPRLVQQTPETVVAPIVAEVSPNIQTARINSAPRAKPLIALSDIPADAGITAFARPIPLPQIDLVSSFVDVSTPVLPVATSKGLAETTHVSVDRRVIYLPVAFALRDQPYIIDTTPPIFDWQWASRNRNP